MKTLKDEINKIVDFDHNFDVFFRKIEIKDEFVEVLFLTTLVDLDMINKLLEELKKVDLKEELIKQISTAVIKKEENLNNLLSGFYYGEAILIYQEEYFLIDVKKIPTRGIEEPYSEKAIRGSRDGFNESISTNIGLIRIRIKDARLKNEMHVVSKYGQTSVCLVYLENKVDHKILEILRKRIDSLKINSLIMTDRSLEEKIFDQRMIIYPLVRYTERPDVASIHVMNGKIVIVVDTSSSVLITPISLFDHFKHVEEFRQTPIIGSFTKLLRIISVILSLFLSPTILALYTDHDITHYFSLTIDSTNGQLAFEMIAATIILEIFRIAVVHTPSPLVGAISLVSALVLGQVSLELGIFSNEILLVVCISAICGYATPSYELSLSNKLVSLILLLMVTFFKIEGFLIGLILLFLYLVNIKIFEVPYLSPFCPIDTKKLLEFFFRPSSKDKENC